jgi:hypothetical protein
LHTKREVRERLDRKGRLLALWWPGEDIFRQVADGDGLRAAQQSGAFDGVPQLSHVARPGVATKDIERVDGSAASPNTPLRSCSLDEDTHERLDLVQALAQGGDLEPDAVQPEVEVLAKRSVLDHGVEVAVRCSHEANVDPHVGRGPDAADPLGLDCAKERCLSGQRQLSDLVQEQGAAAGTLQHSDRPGNGVRESTSLVPEQGRLEQ